MIKKSEEPEIEEPEIEEPETEEPETEEPETEEPKTRTGTTASQAENSATIPDVDSVARRAAEIVQEILRGNQENDEYTQSDRSDRGSEDDTTEDEPENKPWYEKDIFTGK